MQKIQKNIFTTMNLYILQKINTYFHRFPKMTVLSKILNRETGVNTSLRRDCLLNSFNTTASGIECVVVGKQMRGKKIIKMMDKVRERKYEGLKRKVQRKPRRKN